MNPQIPIEGRIADVEALEQLFGKPVRTARQESDRLPADFQASIEQAPFPILATSGPDGLEMFARRPAIEAVVRRPPARRRITPVRRAPRSMP